MRIVFCDDDKAFLEHFVKSVSEYAVNLKLSNVEVVAYLSGEELLRNETRADIAFLDVEMPGENGLTLCRHLKEHNPWVKIFIVTAHPEYLDEAFDYGVFRFIEKPVDKRLLYDRLNKAFKDYAKSTTEITIETNNRVFTLPANEIMCFEYYKRGSIVHTINDSYRTTRTIDYWEKNLNLPCFYKTNRGYIVNMRYIKSFSSEDCKIRLAYRDKAVMAYLTVREYTDFKMAFYLFKGSLL